MLRDAPNLPSLWGALIVEELVRNGVQHFVVCPGSRSTPLVQAVARHPEAQATVWLDERGAGFHALGRARSDGWPCAVITTSGTAVANLLPAAVEASLDGVPLLLLTADRPPELRRVGANQSIRQIGMFAEHVRWSFDLPAPGTDMPARALLTTVDEAVHRALDGHAGPVQLNCPFREPLAPTAAPWPADWLDDVAAWLDGGAPLVQFPMGDLVEHLHAEGLVALLRAAERGVVVCGAVPYQHDAECVAALAGHLGWPLWADLRSGLRLGPGRPARHLHLDRILAAPGAPQPDVVLQFGGRLTSRAMQASLDRGGAAAHLLVDPEPSRLDPGHRVTHRVVSDVDAFCEIAEELLEAEGPGAAALDLRARDERVAAATAAAVEDGEALSEPWVARCLSRRIAPEHVLFVSNSMAVRDLQAYAVGDGPDVAVAANRGASGIDGIVSTAAGFAQGMDTAATLLVGDLALLHDVNALAMLKTLAQPLTIVVLNNGGGSIFSFLPIAEHQDVLTPYVDTPHAITFDGICASFDIPHTHVDTRDAFEQAYREAARAGVPWVIEVDSSLAANRAHHLRIEAAIEQALAEA